MSSRAQTADLLPAHVHGVYFGAVHSIDRDIMTKSGRLSFIRLCRHIRLKVLTSTPDPWPTTIDGAAGADAAVWSRLQS